VSDSAVVVVGEGGAAWATWEGRPGAPLGPAPTDDVMAAQERWARIEVDSTTPPVALAAAGPPPTGTRPPEGFSRGGPLRICGNTFAGGGIGWHIIRNSDDVWQRIEWTKKPKDPSVLALTLDAYPLADATGALCGWATQKEPRNWVVHSTKSAVVVDAAPDAEHPPAHCTGDGAILVKTKDGGVKLLPDGTIQPAPLPADGSAPRDITMEGTSTLSSPRDSVVVHMADNSVRTIALPTAEDLLHRPLPSSSTRERLVMVGDGDHTLLVNERVLLADCGVRESLLLFDVNTGTASLLAEGDTMFLKLSYGLGRFWWVQTSPRIVDVSGGVATR
jgi:hypothetical protein